VYRYVLSDSYQAKTSVADPDFHPSRIPDPRTAPKEEGKIFFCPNIFGSHKYHKMENNFILVLFTQKFVVKLSKIWVWDSRSGKNLFSIPDQKGIGSRIRIRYTGKNPTEMIGLLPLSL
jgi:hypothetical protein